MESSVLTELSRSGARVALTEGAHFDVFSTAFFSRHIVTHVALGVWGSS